MKKFAIAFALLLSAIPVFAQSQVLVPDYTDISKWDYIECESPDMVKSVDRDGEYFVYHEDYEFKSDTQSRISRAVFIVYKPVEVNRKFLEDNFEYTRPVFKRNLWLMVEMGEGRGVSGNTVVPDSFINLFEYRDGSWSFVYKLEGDKVNPAYLNQYLLENYDIVFN